MSLRVVLADGQTLYREAIKSALEQEDFEVVGQASDGRDAISQCRFLRPDLVVLDVSMPLITGIDAAREIVRVCPNTRVVILGEHAADKYIRESLKAGAKGYVVKGDSAAELVCALRKVAKGETYITRSASAIVQGQQTGIESAEPLGVRERQVLRLIAEGKRTEEIAGILDISYTTVRSHKKHIMDKLGVYDTAGLVRYSINSGLLEA
jgi:two-component system, NarL family, response regulator NreC